MSAFIQEKELVVNEIKEKLDRASSAVVVDYRGITVAEADLLRKRMREANVEYKIYKNTMMRRAVEGTNFEGLTEVLKGPSGIAFGFEDATAPAKILDKFVKEFKKMELKGGVVDGAFYDAAGIGQLAQIPSKEELLADLEAYGPVGVLVKTNWVPTTMNHAAVLTAYDEATDTVTLNDPFYGSAVSWSWDAFDGIWGLNYAGDRDYSGEVVRRIFFEIYPKNR